MVELLSIILAVLGTFIIATHGQLGNLAITPVGLFWGLFQRLLTWLTSSFQSN